jgi:hypothetical protein
MIKRDIRYLVTVLIMFTVSFAFIGGDCSSDSEDPEPTPPGSVQPPTNLSIELDAVPGGGSYALIAWSSSTDENNANFRGYDVNTYIVDENGIIDTIIGSYQGARSPRTYTLSSLERGVRYKTYVSAVLNDGTRSDSVATPVFGGVYYNNNGVIDEFSSNNGAESGYGWDPVTGAGNQYSYTSSNVSNIDLHLRSEDGQLKFFSPNIQSPGTKTTLIRLIGTGDDAFDQVNLEEPNLTSVNVNEDEVYLLKTDEGYYIKVWVKDINLVVSVPPYNEVSFEYKVQPIEGLRILKK